MSLLLSPSVNGSLYVAQWTTKGPFTRTRRESEDSIQATKHASEGIHPGFGIYGRCYQKSKKGYQLPHKMGSYSRKNFFKKSNQRK